MTIEVTSHIMKGRKVVYLLIEAANSVVTIIRIDVHKVNWLPCQKQQGNKDVMGIDDVVPKSRAETTEAVMDIGHVIVTLAHPVSWHIMSH
jgi:hypothetical protein